MASGGHSLTLPSGYGSNNSSNSTSAVSTTTNGGEQGGINNNSSSISSPSLLQPVWTAQVPLSANGPADLCWQMVESGQQAVQLRRRRHSQRLFHLGRTLLLKHLPRDVTEHVSSPLSLSLASFCV